LESRRGLFVVDAGGNTLLKVRRPGQVATAAVFPATPLPPTPGFPPVLDAVPTAAAYGPDGAIYVSQLTGFPFPVGGASIWRVVPGQPPTRYATGLTTVTDLAFGKDGSLYVVQIADTGLADPAATGSVVRIPPGGAGPRETVAANLTAPYGIALHGHSAYVTTCSTCAGGGEVLRVPLGGSSRV
jgi:sugar lactone lactonase YvrE